MLPIVAAVLVPLAVVVIVVVAGAMHSGRKPIQFAGESIALQPAGKNRKGQHGKRKEIKTNSAVNKLQRAKGKNNVEFVPHLSQ